MSGIFTGEFRRDVARVLIVVVILASVITAAASYAADRYFGDTVSGLIGDYGEYDLVLNVREDVLDSALPQIREIVKSELRGVRIKQGMSISGTANILVSLPDSMRNAASIESFPNHFVNVPGYLGYGVMIEPRVEVTGVGSYADALLTEKFEKMDGVSFAFHHHGNIAVVLNSSDKAAEVEENIKQLLKHYNVVEVRFPISGQVTDIKEAQARLEEAMKKVLPGKTISSSASSGAGDLTDLTATLTEMRKFLTYYATEIRLHGVVRELAVGDSVALKPRIESADAGVAGGDVLVTITEAYPDKGEYKGMVIKGSVGDAKAFDVYDLVGNAVNEWIGEATADSQVKQLAYSVDQGIQLVNDLSKSTSSALATAKEAERLLGNYDSAVDGLMQVKQNISEISQLIEEQGVEGIYQSRARSLISAMEQAQVYINQMEKGIESVSRVATGVTQTLESADAIDSVLEAGLASVSKDENATSYASAQLLKAVLSGIQSSMQTNRDRTEQFLERVSPALDSISRWRDTLAGYGDGLQTLSSLLDNATTAGEFLDKFAGLTDSALAGLQSLDIERAKQQLHGLLASIEEIGKIDVNSITDQLKHVRESLPNLKDDQIGRSISLIDSFIGGQVIPGDRLQVVVDGDVPLSLAKRVVSTTFEGQGASVTVTPAGSVEPGMRTQLMKVIGEVRNTIGAILAVVLTFLTLVFDHSSVMAVMKRLDMRRSVAGDKQIAMAPIYGAVVGAVVLTSVSMITGARLPYLGLGTIFAIGVVMGLIASLISDKVSPVDMDEVMAGAAMGLPSAALMREIVLPSGRPGPFYLLNKAHMTF